LKKSSDNRDLRGHKTGIAVRLEESRTEKEQKKKAHRLR